ADHLANGLAPASIAGTTSGTLFAFRAALTLAPGASTRLRYGFGMAHGDQVAGLVARYRAAADPLAASQAAWACCVSQGDRARYGCGMAPGDRVAGLVARYRAAADPLAASQAAWAGWVPRADFGAGN